jgi:hypothetical protein
MADSGPKMAVAAYFPFDDRVLDGGVTASWAWAMSQWDRVATAGRAVRLVVADQPYGDLNPDTQGGAISDMKEKFAACRTAEQLVFGYVYGAGGRIPVGPPGQTYENPADPTKQVRCVGDQIDAWQGLYGDQIDGIYVDVGPTDCNSERQSPAPANYTDYVNYIRRYSYHVFLLAPLYGDRMPVTEPWLRNLAFSYIGLWESGWQPYMGGGYKAINYCDPTWADTWPPDDPQSPTSIPEWWHEDQSLRHSRVHIINDCPDEQKMREVADEAVDRGAWTIWITLARKVAGESVYDQLPPYWDAEVRHFADAPPPDTVAPTAPTGLVATVSGSNVYLSWNAATDNVGVIAYGVYRDGVKLADLYSLLNFEDLNVPGGPYTYAVDAVDAAGNRSPRSNGVVVELGYPVAPVVSIVPRVDPNVSKTYTVHAEDPYTRGAVPGRVEIYNPYNHLHPIVSMTVRTDQPFRIAFAKVDITGNPPTAPAMWVKPDDQTRYKTVWRSLGLNVPPPKSASMSDNRGGHIQNEGNPNGKIALALAGGVLIGIILMATGKPMLRLLIRQSTGGH